MDPSDDLLAGTPLIATQLFLAARNETGTHVHLCSAVILFCYYHSSL